MELMQASHQWATRPADQRFVSLIELRDHCAGVRRHSHAKVLSTRAIQAAPLSGDSKALVLVGPDGNAANVSHWSFGQLCQRAEAPAGYLRTLPAELAADNINYGLKRRDVEDVGILLGRDDSSAALVRAITGPTYGRIWNAEIADALVARFGDGITGSFRVPGEWGKRVEVTKDNTTLYASDRDMFVFLADEDHRIEVPNRRDGKSGAMARGFFVSNSEVGAGTLSVATFLFDYVCGNRIVWGAHDFAEIKIRHTAGAPDRWMEEVAPAIRAYASSSTASVTRAIADAKAKRIEDVDAFLATRFTKSQVSGIKAAHLADESRPIESLWDATTGVTAYARGVEYQDARVDLERKGGAILKLAA